MCRKWYRTSIGSTIYCNDVDSDKGHQYDQLYTEMMWTVIQGINTTYNILK